jgi:nitrate/nitrite transporter NarK
MPGSSAEASWIFRYSPHIAVFSVGYVLFVYAAVPNIFMTRFAMGFTALGLLMSAALFSVVLAQPLCSRLTTRISTTNILLAATVMHVLLAIALDFAQTFRTLLALRAVWGLAAGIILTSGGTHIARLYSGSAATRQQGIYGGMLTFGGALSFLLAPHLRLPFVPFDLFIPGALLGIPAIGILWWYRRDRTTAPQRPHSLSNSDANLSAQYILTHPAIIVASLCYIASLGSYVTLSTFITAYFDDLGVIGPLNVFVLLVASVARALGGAVVQWWSIGDRRIVRFATVSATLGFMLLAIVQSPPYIIILPFVVMLAVSFPFGAIYHIATETITEEGTALAIVIAAGNIAALILPTFTGILRATSGGYSSGFLLLGAINAVAVGSIVWLR